MGTWCKVSYGGIYLGVLTATTNGVRLGIGRNHDPRRLDLCPPCEKWWEESRPR